MDQEKESLKNELGGLEGKENLEKFVEDSKLLGHEDIAALGREKINALNAIAVETSANPDTTPEDKQQIEQIKNETAENINEISQEPATEIPKPPAERPENFIGIKNETATSVPEKTFENPEDDPEISSAEKRIIELIKGTLPENADQKDVSVARVHRTMEVYRSMYLENKDKMDAYIKTGDSKYANTDLFPGWYVHLKQAKLDSEKAANEEKLAEEVKTKEKPSQGKVIEEVKNEEKKEGDIEKPKTYTDVLVKQYSDKERQKLDTQKENLLKSNEELPNILNDAEISAILEKGKTAARLNEQYNNQFTLKDLNEVVLSFKNKLKDKYPSTSTFFNIGNGRKTEQWSVEEIKKTLGNWDNNFKNKEISFDKDMAEYGNTVNLNREFVINREGEEAKKNIEMYEDYELSGKNILNYISENLNIDRFDTDGKTENKKFNEMLKKLQEIGNYHGNFIRHSWTEDGRKSMNKLSDWLAQSR